MLLYLLLLYSDVCAGISTPATQSSAHRDPPRRESAILIDPTSVRARVSIGGECNQNHARATCATCRLTPLRDGSFDVMATVDRARTAASAHVTTDCAVTAGQWREAERVVFREIRGFGAEMPVATNTADEGRIRNRRVEVWVY